MYANPFESKQISFHLHCKALEHKLCKFHSILYDFYLLSLTFCSVTLITAHGVGDILYSYFLVPTKYPKYLHPIFYSKSLAAWVPLRVPQASAWPPRSASANPAQRTEIAPQVNSCSHLYDEALRVHVLGFVNVIKWLCYPWEEEKGNLKRLSDWENK